MKEKKQNVENEDSQAESLDNSSRRGFLGHLTKAGIAAAAIGAVGVKPFLGGKSSEVAAQNKGIAPKGPTNVVERANLSRHIRYAAADEEFAATVLDHPNNGDEALYPNRIGNFTKGMPHDANGEVLPAAYNQFLTAVNSGNPADFEAIPRGGIRRFTNPQAGLGFDLEGANGHALFIPPPPAFASREQAAEIAENYWMAVLRDIPFAEYPTNPAAAAAAADLMSFGSDFKGLKHSDGSITPDILFRGVLRGDGIGPYFSQFFYLPIFFGANLVNQKIRTVNDLVNGGLEYGLDFDSWLNIQNANVEGTDLFADDAKFMYRGCDIGQYVHVDVLFQAYFQAFLVLDTINAPYDGNNPYRSSTNQSGFGTFGPPHIASLLSGAAHKALKAEWYQKWFVHRRQRPEDFAGRIHQTVYMGRNYPVHPDIIASVTTSSRLGGFLRPNNAFMPLAFPEGSPLHLAYGAGHATVAGACVTLLKAFFDENFVIPSPMIPDATGDNLIPYTGTAPLTVGNELNKIASNISLGRNIAGVHWRSDGTESLLLGEQLAISLLSDARSLYNENFNGFSLRKFNGEQIVIGG